MDEHDLLLSSNLKPAHTGLPPTGLMSVTAILLLTLAKMLFATTPTEPGVFATASGPQRQSWLYRVESASTPPLNHLGLNQSYTDAS
jgi:hypothetical protein